MAKLTKEEKLIRDYDSNPTFSKELKKRMKKYAIMRGLKKKNGKDYLCISVIKSKNKNYCELVKDVLLEEL